MHKVNKLRIFIENKDMTEDAGIRHTKIREGIIHFLKTMTIKSIKKDLRVLEIGAGDLKICKQILGNKSSPFTFRSHNPTDYWRFTADGFKYLFKNFQECSVYSTYLNEQERAEHLPLSMFVLAKN